MPRIGRVSPGGGLYHVYNRGNGRLRLFNRPEDYERFVALLQEGRERANVRLMGFCVMPTHWHLLLRPIGDHDLSTYVGWISNAHVRRWHQAHRSVGGGHIYQGRYRSFPVQPNEQCLAVLRYIEANAVRAGLVQDALRWGCSSLAMRQARLRPIALDPLPVSLPEDWVQRVNTPMGDVELKALRTCLRRGRPFGTVHWCDQTAQDLNLRHTLRNPWRPKTIARDYA